MLRLVNCGMLLAFSVCLSTFVRGGVVHSGRALGRRGTRGRLLNPLADIIGDGSVDDLSSSNRSVAMLEDGYILVSSETSNGVTFELWSESTATASTKRSINELSTPNKRATIDIQGRNCATACAWQTNVPKPNPNDCTPAYQELYAKVGIFTLPPTQALSATIGTCSIWTVNHSSNDITYDYWDAGGTGQWLNGDCIIQQSATVGLCMYDNIGTNVTNGVWTAVCAPSFMTG